MKHRVDRIVRNCIHDKRSRDFTSCNFGILTALLKKVFTYNSLNRGLHVSVIRMIAINAYFRVLLVGLTFGLGKHFGGEKTKAH